MTANELVTHLQFSAWASKRMLDAAAQLSPQEVTRDLKTSHASVLNTLAHIYQADRIWFSRLEGVPRMTLTDPGEEHTLAVLQRDWPPLHARFVAWASSLEDADMDRVVVYKNTKGQAFEQRVSQAILHLVNHASYHRGQVTTLLRQLGRVPPGTDLIAYYRSL